MGRRIVRACGWILLVTVVIYRWQPILAFLGRSAALMAGAGPAAAEHGQGYDETFALPAAAAAPNVKTVNLAMTSGRYTTVDGIALKNGTGYAVDIAETLRRKFEKPSLSKDRPVVLIYHTHAQEKYAEGTSGVVELGERMKERFERNGMKTVHITTDFTKGGSFNTSYTRSLAGVKEALEKYPSIKIVLDIHRDSITDGGKDCAPVAAIGGQNYAQVMLICGTDDKGLSHPEWRKNLRFALALAQTAQAEYKGLFRPVDLNANRYNTHATPYALLMEIGSDASSSADAERSAIAVADIIVKTVK